MRYLTIETLRGNAARRTTQSERPRGFRALRPPESLEDRLPLAATIPGIPTPVDTIDWAFDAYDATTGGDTSAREDFNDLAAKLGGGIDFVLVRTFGMCLGSAFGLVLKGVANRPEFDLTFGIQNLADVAVPFAATSD